MKPERWRQIEQLYHSALEQAPAQRTVFLNEACQGDAELRREVESLLAQSGSTEALADHTAWAAADAWAATQASLKPGDTVGPYRISGLLGAGGMGKVYSAVDTRLDRKVAIKIAQERFGGRFEREARAISALNHPNICTLYDIGPNYLVTELVEGETLGDLLQRAPSAERSLEIARQVLEALRAAHHAGIIHRDLKPQNIMIRFDGYVKVLDFGLAKWIAPPPAAPAGKTVPKDMTLSGEILGTIAYMSPEQLLGQKVDQRSDLFALGIILYEMLAGQNPWRRSSTVDTLHAIVHDEPPPLEPKAAAAVELAAVVQKLLRKDPAERYPSAEAVLEALPLRPGEAAVPRAPGWPPRSRRRLLFGGLLTAVALWLAVWGAGKWRGRLPAGQPEPIQSLAVLPFENLSHDPEQEYFAEGMTDELITALAKVRALRVVSRTSVMPYKTTRKPLPEIARELKVDAVLEGTVLRDRNRVRITAQLIRGAPEEHLWAQQYEGDLEQVLSLQNSVAQAVTRSIQVKLTPRERTQLATARAVDPAAYDAYLKGRYLWGSPGEEELKKSRDYLEEAIDKDPGYALAWAGLADTYNDLASWGILPVREVAPRARAAAEKALELDNTLAGPLVALAEVKFHYEWDWDGAERLCRQAIESNPNYGEAHHVYATLLATVGRTREAVAEARKAQQVEPLSPVYGWNVVWKLYVDRQYQEAEAESRKLIAWDPKFAGSYVTASLYLTTGRRAEAVAELRRDVVESHRGRIELMYLGHALGVTGARTEGRAVLEELLSLDRRSYVPPEWIAIVYEGLGERDQALQWFERAVEERSMNGWFLPDPQLDPIRSDTRFQKLMRRMGLPR